MVAWGGKAYEGRWGSRTWVGVKSVLDTCLFFWYKNCMSRPLRIEYKDAWYHAMNRGRNWEVIFHEEMGVGLGDVH